MVTEIDYEHLILPIHKRKTGYIKSRCMWQNNKTFSNPFKLLFLYSDIYYLEKILEHISYTVRTLNKEVVLYILWNPKNKITKYNTLIKKYKQKQ